MNGKPYVYGREYGREHREIRIGFISSTFLSALIHPSCRAMGSRGERTKSEDSALVLTILDAGHSEKSLLAWQDSGLDRVEQHLTEAAIEIALTAEAQYRKRALSHHQWLIERRAAIGGGTTSEKACMTPARFARAGGSES